MVISRSTRYYESNILAGLQLALKRQEPFLSAIGAPRSQIEKKVAMKNAAPRKKYIFLPPPAEMLSQLEEEEVL